MTHDIKHPEKISILRLSAIGDVLMMLPAIRLLKKQFPHTQIDWLVDRSIVSLLAELKDVNIIAIDKPKTWVDFWHFRQQWKQHNMGQLLSFQTSSLSNILMLLVNAEHKTGFGAPYAREGHQYCCDTAYSLANNLHQVDIFFELAKKFSGLNEPIKITAADLELPTSSADNKWAAAQLQTHTRWIAINPMASALDRTWPVERYIEVINHLQQEYPDTGLVLTGGPSEKERQFASQIEQQTTANCLNLVAKTTLTQLAALFKQVNLLIAPDTGPIHLGAAQGTICLGLYAAKRPEYTGPYQQADHCINAYPEAAEKLMHKKAAQLAWQKNIPGATAVELISVDQVMQKVKQLYKHH
ncbi:MAG: hypothetical protein GQ582_11115 [Methyloprofundus sp.]|nr:hypothetical protein [Methyloprofundus sp.]